MKRAQLSLGLVQPEGHAHPQYSTVAVVRCSAAFSRSPVRRWKVAEAEVAFLLGYQDPSTLQRAFRR
jgi:hypothetical protein